MLPAVARHGRIVHRSRGPMCILLAPTGREEERKRKETYVALVDFDKIGTWGYLLEVGVIFSTLLQDRTWVFCPMGT